MQKPDSKRLVGYRRASGLLPIMSTGRMAEAAEALCEHLQVHGFEQARALPGYNES